MYRLYGCKGCGSAAIEAALVLAGQAYDYVEYDIDSPDAQAQAALRALNPLAQVPTLVAPDGTVLCESVAILIWLDAQYPAAGLLPASAAERATVLRWLVYLSANAYAAIGIGDYPDRWIAGDDAQAALRAGAKARLQVYWQTFEDQLDARPYCFGDRLSALDLLAATMSHWRPGRAWFDEHCPKLMAKVHRTEAEPALAAVWARNFPQAS